MHGNSRMIQIDSLHVIIPNINSVLARFYSQCYIVSVLLGTHTHMYMYIVALLDLTTDVSLRFRSGQTSKRERTQKNTFLCLEQKHKPPLSRIYPHTIFLISDFPFRFLNQFKQMKIFANNLKQLYSQRSRPYEYDEKICQQIIDDFKFINNN